MITLQTPQTCVFYLIEAYNLLYKSGKMFCRKHNHSYFTKDISIKPYTLVQLQTLNATYSRIQLFFILCKNNCFTYVTYIIIYLLIFLYIYKLHTKQFYEMHQIKHISRILIIQLSKTNHYDQKLSYNTNYITVIVKHRRIINLHSLKI